MGSGEVVREVIWWNGMGAGFADKDSIFNNIVENVGHCCNIQ
jgi:hypothetical protein